MDAPNPHNADSEETGSEKSSQPEANEPSPAQKTFSTTALKGGQTPLKSAGPHRPSQALADNVPAHPIPPLVTVGIPVFNGENFLAAALDSILTQTFEDFELIISDNASTDATADICQRYVRRDRRIRYYRSSINRGPAWNFNRVFDLARGRYFKWAAHDDLIAPTFLEQTVSRLICNPAAVLGFSAVEVLNHESKQITPYHVELANRHHNPAHRLKDMMSLKHRCYEIFGLIRTSVLAKTPLIGSYAGSDRVLLSELSLYGPFEIVPDPLFRARQHPQQSIAMLRSPRHRHLRMHDYAIWFDPKNKGKVLLPNWKLFYEYFCAIASAPLQRQQRLQCYGVLLHWLFTYSNWLKLGRDIVIAAMLLGLKVKLFLLRDIRFGRRPQAASSHLSEPYPPADPFEHTTRPSDRKLAKHSTDSPRRKRRK